MSRIATVRRMVLAAALALGLLAALYAVRSSSASSSARATSWRPRRTQLSVERRGTFICKASFCLSLWTPLVVAKGTTPTGVSGLATIKRPDGPTQVTYHGGPLYTFHLDRKRGDLKGEGFKDVGTWHAASPGKQTSAVPAPPGGGYRP